MSYLIPFRRCLLFIFVFGVSAYPSSPNYLQHNQKLKTGKTSSLDEIDFHTLKDFTILQNPSHLSRTTTNQDDHEQQQQQEQDQQSKSHHQLKKYQKKHNHNSQNEMLLYDLDQVVIPSSRNTEGIRTFHYRPQMMENLDPANHFKYETYDNIEHVENADGDDAGNNMYDINNDPSNDDDDNDSDVTSITVPVSSIDSNTNANKQDAYNGNENSFEWKFLKNSPETNGNNPNIKWKLLKENISETSDEEKRNAFRAAKRQKSKRPQHQTKFIPSISVGAMTNLGDFFDNLKNNVEYLERKGFTENQLQLLDGDHPISKLRQEISSENYDSRPTGTAAFLHAIRTYRPSQRVRALVSTQPDGYHGSNFLDPNYMWLGLGK